MEPLTRKNVVPVRIQYQVSAPVHSARSTDRRLCGTLRVRRGERRRPGTDPVSKARKRRGQRANHRLGLASLSHLVWSAKRPFQGRSTLCASHPRFDKNPNIEGASSVRPGPSTKPARPRKPPMTANRGRHRICGIRWQLCGYSIALVLSAQASSSWRPDDSGTSGQVAVQHRARFDGHCAHMPVDHYRFARLRPVERDTSPPAIHSSA